MIRDVAGVPATPSATPARQAAPTGSQTASEPRPTPGQPMLNPRMRIDTALNLVVLEFRDEDGEVNQSIPSPQEIAAYRQQSQQTEADPQASAENAAALDVMR